MIFLQSQALDFNSNRILSQLFLSKLLKNLKYHFRIALYIFFKLRSQDDMPNSQQVC